MMEIDGKITTHHQTTAEEFNNYYVSGADNITDNNPVNNTIGDLNKNDPLNYLYFAFQQSFTNIKLKNTNTGETEKITKELKSKKSCGYTVRSKGSWTEFFTTFLPTPSTRL